uniref:L1 transposable element RRM domain-containing protein n=1 Tax=Latimeria chalumnae TaxID=7897 RepID=H3AFL7_LATCH
ILTMLNKLIDSVNELKTDNKNFLHRLTEVEQRTGVMEEEPAKEKKQVAALDAKIMSLAQRLDDQENRARRNNLHILGFPEQIEKGKPIQFLQEVLPKTLGLDDGIQLELEQAHCSLAPRPDAGQRSRPFIVKFLRFQTKEMIIRKARERQQDPHLSRELQEKRRRFTEVKKQLREREIKYGLFYPAILKITWEGKDYSCNSPNEAQAFLKRQPLTSSSGSNKTE